MTPFLDSVVNGVCAPQIRRFGGHTLPRRWYLRRFLLGHPDLHHYFDLNFDFGFDYPEWALNIRILLVIRAQNCAYVYGVFSALVSA